MKQFDAANTKLSDGLFAEAYRATIPTLADATHVTVRACSARFAELSSTATDISDVVELGTAKDGKVRVVAVPVDVHVDSGAAVIQDDTFDKRVVSFEVNGTPQVQIVNLALSLTEAKAEQAAKDAQAATVASSADAAFQKQLADAKEEGRKAALLEQAKQAGAATVAQTPAPTGKVQ